MALQKNAGDFNIRITNVAYLLKQAFRVLFSRKNSAVVAQVVLYVPPSPDEKEPSVAIEGRGIFTGPVPAMNQMVKNIMDTHVRNLIDSGMGKILMRNPGEQCDECGEVHAGGDGPRVH